MQVHTSTRQARRRRSKVEQEKYIVQLKSGVHAGKFLVKAPYIERDELGRLTYKRYGPFASLDDAVRERDKHLAKQLEGEVVPLGREAKAMTLGTWAQHWLGVIVRKNNATGSFDRYSSSFERHVLPQLGHLALVDLTKMRIERWQAELVAQGIGAEAINYALKRLKTCLEAALDEQSIGLKANVARRVKALVTESEDTYAGHPDDYPKILAALEGDYRQAFPLIGVHTGMRRSELAGLHWADVDLAARLVTIRWHYVSSGQVRAFRPGSKARQDGKIVYETIHLSQAAVEAFQAHKERLLQHKMATRSWVADAVDATFYAANKNISTGTPYVVPQNPVAPNALVFPSADGTPWDTDIMGDWFTRVCARAGLKRSLHSMRHDCGSFMLGANPPVPITVVSKHLRHASVDITANTYAHVLRGMERTGADALDQVWAALDAQAVAV